MDLIVDHFSKFPFFVPNDNEDGCKNCLQLNWYFCMITPPTMLPTDNVRRFTAHVIKEMVEICPGFTIVLGSPRHPQSQGSVERSNAHVKQMLTAWAIDNDTTKWADGLRFVQLQKTHPLVSTWTIEHHWKLSVAGRKRLGFKDRPAKGGHHKARKRRGHFRSPVQNVSCMWTERCAWGSWGWK